MKRILSLAFFRHIHRSMIGQMLFLSLLFVSATVYYFAYVPITDLDLSEPDPTVYTVEKVRRELRDFIDAIASGNSKTETFTFSEELQALMSSNPHFSYFMLVDGKTYSNGRTPQYYSNLGFDTLDGVNRQISHPKLCTTLLEPIRNGDDYGYMQYNYCNGSNYYLEFSGITTAVAPPKNSLWLFYKRNVLDVGANLMLPALGVFFITAMILLINWRLMNKVARVAYSFNPKNLHKKLPEKGLPNEVLPLVQAVNEMLGRIDETQKQHNFFLSTAAHEMRTPLTVLRTRLEMMDDGPLKEKLIDDVRRLANLVNQLLRLMRIGGAKVHEHDIDLLQCCQRVVRERQVLAENAQVNLLLRSTQSSLLLPGDEGIMEVAIANLIDNAVSFSEPGATVEIDVLADYRIVVRDHGPGLAFDKLTNLFDPFAKFPPNRNGHGLGLAIVKAIVQLHGGSVKADNASDGGAVFTLQFTPPTDKKTPGSS